MVITEGGLYKSVLRDMIITEIDLHHNDGALGWAGMTACFVVLHAKYLFVDIWLLLCA